MEFCVNFSVGDILVAYKDVSEKNRREIELQKYRLEHYIIFVIARMCKVFENENEKKKNGRGRDFQPTVEFEVGRDEKFNICNSSCTIFTLSDSREIYTYSPLIKVVLIASSVTLISPFFLSCNIKVLFNIFQSTQTKLRLSTIFLQHPEIMKNTGYNRAISSIKPGTFLLIFCYKQLKAKNKRIVETYIGTGHYIRRQYHNEHPPKKLGCRNLVMTFGTTLVFYISFLFLLH